MIGIGNTPLSKIEKLTDSDCADIYVKFEGGNPTGSMKDRMALSMIEGAEKRGAYRAKILGPGKKILTVVCDSGLKYLQGDLYK